MISTLLVANRGEIASRIFRTCRANGIRTVAVYAAPDAGLPFVREADTAVALGGTSASDSYLVIDKVIDAARRSGADAIHPGFGFLSENAAFAQAVLDAGLTWVGPTPANIAAMGTKVEAKRIAANAGVPVLPSEVAVGDDAATWRAAADERVGYPVLVKASSGGGGRGMRIVASSDGLGEAVVGARREAASSFGDATVFLERYLPGARHIEIQVFGDTHGNVVHLGERECSIQRRHQKIVEEAPSPVLTPDMRDAMGSAAVSLARSIGYVGAGTVEFLYDDTGSSPVFFFLEMNTRLQVEHPVTECVTGLDLVQWQLDVANGESLPITQADVRCDGAAIEVRLYAEDPANDFLPGFGRLYTYDHAVAGPGMRFEDGVATGSDVTTAFDPMIAKVVAHAPTRTQAAAKLRSALRGMSIHGPITNRDYLAAILGDADYLAGATTTAYVDQHPELRTPTVADDVVRRHAAVATVLGSLRRRRTDRLWGFAGAGLRNLPSQPQRLAYVLGDGELAVAYTWDPFAADRCTLTIGAGESATEHVLHIISAQIIDDATDCVTVDLDSLTESFTVHSIGERRWVNTSTAQTEWTETERFPTSALAATAGGPIAPVPGKVVAVHVTAGQTVAAGDLLVIMEAMKMEHRIEAAAPGTVGEVLCSVGDQVDAHQVLVTLNAVAAS